MAFTDEDLPEVNVVFGASGDIGSTLCRTLASRGSRLFLAGRDSHRLESLAAELQVPYQTVDGNNPDQFEQCLAAAQSKYGGVTGVAN
jgi:NADP-dependent 3-hydroxy acid dehydrogenase YdfG